MRTLAGPHQKVSFWIGVSWNGQGLVGMARVAGLVGVRVRALVRVRVKGLVRVRVKGWVIHYTYEHPHKDQSTRMCVLQSGGPDFSFSVLFSGGGKKQLIFWVGGVTIAGTAFLTWPAYLNPGPQCRFQVGFSFQPECSFPALSSPCCRPASPQPVGSDTVPTSSTASGMLVSS